MLGCFMFLLGSPISLDMLFSIYYTWVFSNGTWYNNVIMSNIYSLEGLPCTCYSCWSLPPVSSTLASSTIVMSSWMVAQRRRRTMMVRTAVHPSWWIKPGRYLTSLNLILIQIKIIHHLHHISPLFPVIKHWWRALISWGSHDITIRI